MKTRAIMGAVCVAACLSASADAKNIPAGGITQDELAAWMREHGAPITVNSLPQPDPSILGTYLSTSSNGLGYSVYLHDCKAGRCATLLIVGAAGPCTLTLDQINQWNSQRRWLRAFYKADEQLCVGGMDVIAEGASYDNLSVSFGTWEHILIDYIRFASTGSLVASNGREGRAVLPGLVLGKTTYADVLSANGQPRSDEQLAQGGHVVRYPFEALRAHESGAIVSPLVGRDSAGSLAVLTFDAAGILQAYGAAAEPGDVAGGQHTFGTYDSPNTTGALGKLIVNTACGTNCK